MDTCPIFIGRMHDNRCTIYSKVAQRVPETFKLVGPARNMRNITTAKYEIYDIRTNEV